MKTLVFTTMDSKDKTLYTDVVMELLTSYILANEGDNSFLFDFITKTIHEDDTVAGPGFMPGMLFSAIIHLSLLLTVISAITDEPVTEVLSKYGLHYHKIRPHIEEMPQLNPEIVNKIARMFE